MLYFYLRKLIFLWLFAIASNEQLFGMEDYFATASSSDSGALRRTVSYSNITQIGDFQSIESAIEEFKKSNQAYDDFLMLNQYPLLHYAISAGTSQDLKTLIQYLNSNEIKLTEFEVTPYNVKNHKGETALHYAVRLYSEHRLTNFKKIKLLLEQENLDVNLLNNRGQTVLDYAQEQQLFDILQLFPEYKHRGFLTSAELRQSDEESEKSSDWPMANSSIQIIPSYYRLQKVKDQNIPELTFNELNNIQLKKFPFDLYRSKSTGDTLLHTAIRCGSVDAFKLVLKYLNQFAGKTLKQCIEEKIFSKRFFSNKQKDPGKILELRNDDGETPLHLAIRYNNLRIIKLLLLNKANVNALNGMRQTPLDVAYEVSDYDLARFLMGLETKDGENFGAKTYLEIAGEQSQSSRAAAYGTIDESYFANRREKLEDLEKWITTYEERAAKVLQAIENRENEEIVVIEDQQDQVDNERLERHPDPIFLQEESESQQLLSGRNESSQCNSGFRRLIKPMFILGTAAAVGYGLHYLMKKYYIIARKENNKKIFR